MKLNHRSLLNDNKYEQARYNANSKIEFIIITIII